MSCVAQYDFSADMTLYGMFDLLSAAQPPLICFGTGHSVYPRYPWTLSRQTDQRLDGFNACRNELR